MTRALASGWLAPIGPDLTCFESEVAAVVGVPYAVGLSSGTAGLHLGLKFLGVKPGDVVLVPTLTFGATAFAVTYLGAAPVFVDVDASWCMDPQMTREAVTQLRCSGRRVAAAMPVDLYGTPCNYTDLLRVLNEIEVPVLEDAAEGLGSRHVDGMVASFGRAGVLSFNGNKLITTSGGGMLVSDDQELIDKVRFWATQSREDEPWYEHEEIGYNYRLSNILAALGRSQLRRVHDQVSKRRQIREWYRSRLSDIEGVTIQEDPPWGESNAWLTVARFSPERYPDAPTRVRVFLEASNVESRPVWKPMHLQPVFDSNEAFLSGAAEAVFADGLCLPSGAAMTEDDVDRVSSLVISCLRDRGAQ